ncbi:MAG: GIY-YIG nuclease family protein [Candidatus Lokiarchaeota archaeon]|nr:GIY-YIG nuclease family protein [Candidatus Lokiarchaeota archaeon]
MVPAYYVYILKCIDKRGNVSYYTGSTKDLYKRFREHESGKGARYTKGKDLELVYYESYTSNTQARKREAEIKKWKQQKKMKLIESKECDDDG